MKKPSLPEIVHVIFTIDDGWNWRDEMEWHHEEYELPYDFLTYDGTRDTFHLSKAKDKKKKMKQYKWLPEGIINGDYSDIHIVEYGIIKDLEAINKDMNKYGFYVDPSGGWTKKDKFIYNINGENTGCYTGGKED